MSRRQRDAIEQTEFVRNLLAFLLVMAFVGMIPAFLFKSIPEGNNDIITYMLGQLSGMAITVLGFYFVSKVGQDAQDAKRADNTGKLADAVHKALDSTPSPDAAAHGAEETAEAAQHKADEIAGKA